MRQKGCAAAEQEASDLPSRVSGIDDGKAEQGAAQRPDEGMDGVPRAVDPSYLVGEEFSQRAGGGDADDPVIGEDIERLKLVGQGDPAIFHCDARGEDHEIQPPSREQADAGC